MGKMFNTKCLSGILFCFGSFLTNKNDRFSRPFEQSGCGSGDSKKDDVGMYHSSCALQIIFGI